MREERERGKVICGMDKRKRRHICVCGKNKVVRAFA